MYYAKGDDVLFSGWFYFEKSPSLYDAGGLTIWDLESSWAKNLGMRMIMKQHDVLAFELELPKTTYRQPQGSEVQFPMQQWVHIEAHLHLSDTDGIVKVWQDGHCIIDVTKCRTLPVANIVYDRLEVGISAIAKGSLYPQTLYIDDVIISNKPF
jgi:hypothetical protein